MAIKRAKPRSIFKDPVKTGLIAVVIILLLVAGYWHFIHKTVRTVHLPTQNSSLQKPATATTNSTSTAPPSQKVTNPQGGSAANATPTNVTAPSGSFVSNHKPGSLTDQEQSLCSTTIDAMCSISFTKGSSVIKLAAQQTDDNGVTTWDWTPSQLGLGSGAWSVSATATAGSNSQTTSDPVPLEVP